MKKGFAFMCVCVSAAHGLFFITKSTACLGQDELNKVDSTDLMHETITECVFLNSQLVFIYAFLVGYTT